jgi:hypothetical protein
VYLSAMVCRALWRYEDLSMLRNYIMLARADPAQVHRKASPVARLKV